MIPFEMATFNSTYCNIYFLLMSIKYSNCRFTQLFFFDIVLVLLLLLFYGWKCHVISLIASMSRNRLTTAIFCKFFFLLNFVKKCIYWYPSSTAFYRIVDSISRNHGWQFIQIDVNRLFFSAKWVLTGKIQ